MRFTRRHNSSAAPPIIEVSFIVGVRTSNTFIGRLGNCAEMSQKLSWFFVYRFFDSVTASQKLYTVTS